MIVVTNKIIPTMDLANYYHEKKVLCNITFVKVIYDLI